MDGKIIKSARSRIPRTKGSVWGRAREVHTTILGDFGFADDTAITGYEDEVLIAGRTFVQTLIECEERVNTSKTERLRLKSGARMPFDARNAGEASTVRHIGGWLFENRGNDADTRAKCAKATYAIVKMAKACALWTKHGRGVNLQMAISVRLRVAKAIVISI